MNKPMKNIRFNLLDAFLVLVAAIIVIVSAVFIINTYVKNTEITVTLTGENIDRTVASNLSRGQTVKIVGENEIGVITSISIGAYTVDVVRETEDGIKYTEKVPVDGRCTVTVTLSAKAYDAGNAYEFDGRELRAGDKLTVMTTNFYADMMCASLEEVN